MTIPNLPTDNLYKFIALTGIFLFVFAYIYPEYKYQQISDEISILDSEKAKLDIEAERIKDKKEELKEKIEELDKKCNCGTKSIVNDSIITRKVVLEGTPELLQLSRQIDTLVKDYKELQRLQTIKLVEQTTKLKILNQKMTEIVDYRKDQEDYMGISFVIAFLGFIFWYEKTQKYQDKLLKHQYGEYIRTELCQSCGIRLKNNIWFDVLSEEKQKEIKYCDKCFENGQFIEPELTYDQMKQRVIKRCKELKFNRLQRFIYVLRLKQLDRWMKKFKW